MPVDLNKLKYEKSDEMQMNRQVVSGYIVNEAPDFALLISQHRPSSSQMLIFPFA